MAASVSGEQIQALVYELEPLKPTGLGRAVEVVAILLGVVCVLVVSLRVYVRAGLSGASTRTWGAEDFLAVVGTVSFPARLGKVTGFGCRLMIYIGHCC